jgi:DNA-directed RNA polymerase subunit RPC12/RpoP
MEYKCAWCGESLDNKIVVPALCTHCYANAGPADQQSYVQDLKRNEPRDLEPKDKTPDCPCGGETFRLISIDLGMSYRCRECCREIPAEALKEER